MPESWKHWEGQVVEGRFPLSQYLGGSDRSAVFLTHRGQQRSEKLAIKLIPAESSRGEAQLARWAQAAQLSHPSLIRLFESGRSTVGNRSVLFLLMEYAEEVLSQVLPQRSLTQSEVGDMLPSILQALDFLHGNGFVHGHLQPSNLMAVGDLLKLSSDGLCKAGDPGVSRVTRTIYSAPEIVNGTWSPASDVWSLGVCLVEALTQHAPSWPTTNQTVPTVPDSMPMPFRQIALQCLAPDPKQRPSVAKIRQQFELTFSVAKIRQQFELTFKEAKLQAAPAPRPRWRYLVPVLAVAIVLALFIFFLVRDSKPKSSPPIASEHVKAAAKPSPSEPNVERSVKQSDGSTLSHDSAPTSGLPQRAQGGGGSTLPTSGAVVYQVVPDVSQKASDTIQGTIRVAVRVRVDPSGKVMGTEFESRGPSAYFARRAIEAAGKWRFTPAEANGQNVASEWVLRFQFHKTGTKVIPRQVAP